MTMFVLVVALFYSSHKSSLSAGDLPAGDYDCGEDDSLCTAKGCCYAGDDCDEECLDYVYLLYLSCGYTDSCSQWGECYEVVGVCVKDCDSRGCRWSYCDDCDGGGGGGGCTPDGTCACSPALSCPSGYSPTCSVPGACSSTTVSCTKYDNCGDDCGTQTKTCYKLKTCNTCTLPTCPIGYATASQGCSASTCPDGWTRVQKTGDTVYSCTKSCTRYYDGTNISCGESPRYCYVKAKNPNTPEPPDYAIMKTPLETKNLSRTSTSRTIFDYTAGGTVWASQTTTPIDNSISGYRYFLRSTPTSDNLVALGGYAIDRILNYSPFPTTGVLLAERWNYRCPDDTVKQRSELREGYFCMERNVKPSQTPTKLIMNLGGGDVYFLSTSEAAPTVIANPSDLVTEENTTLRVKELWETPDTATSSGYRIGVNNKGVDGEWLPFLCTRGEDFCSVSTSNLFNFDPNTEPILNVLKEGAEGKINASYYNVNQCNTAKIFSDVQSFYYRVNTKSVIPEDPSSCPQIALDDADQEYKGCESTTYTGREVNNPLKFTVKGSDADGVADIRGAIVWLSKDGKSSEIPESSSLLPFYGSSDTDHIAVLLLRNGASWANEPLVYTADVTNGYNWANISSSKQIITSEGLMATVTNPDGNIVGEEVHFSFGLDFALPETGDTFYPEGNYEITGLVFDRHMLNGTFLEQDNMATDCGGWNIDLRPPEFAAGFPYDETSAQYSYTLQLYWNFNGTGSNATDVVLNAYSDIAQEDIILTEPMGYPALPLKPEPPDGEEIGTMGALDSWNIKNDVQSPTYSSFGTVDIGENESGTIVFYVTGFDNACNSVTNDLTVNLNPWMTSKGGFVYSGGNVGLQSKDYTHSAEFLSAGANPILRHVLASELDIATESVTSRANTIYNFIHPDFGAVRASGIYNSNSETTGWYEYLKGRLYQQEAAGIGVDRFILDASGVKTSDFCGSAYNYCYHQTDNGDFRVPKSFEVCDKKTLIMASGDIYLEPDIFNGGEDNLNGCIFLAGGSIYVGAGEWKTDTVTFIEQTEYDYLEAYLLAEDKINIELVDVVDQHGTPIDHRDGLEIYGGLVAFGKDVSVGESAVQVNRSFGLWNAFIPVVATTWDPRYAKIAEGFFGPVSATYKREVGFKPY